MKLPEFAVQSKHYNLTDPYQHVVVKPAYWLFWVVLIFSICANPIAGLVWESRIAVLSVYFIRDFWILIAPIILIIYAANGKSIFMMFGLLLGLIHFALSYVLISKGNVGPEILFLQYRNTFGFILAWGFALIPFNRLDAEKVNKICTAIVVFIFVYCIAEFLSMLLFGFQFADTFFNKSLLESVKGTKANLDAGLLDVLRVPGPLFSPSQLGIMIAYFYLVARITVGGSKSLVLGAMILVVELIAVSKTGIAMILLAEGMILTSRRIAYPALIAVLSGPFLAEWLLFPFLGSYHSASAAYHFAGYLTGLTNLLEYPLGIGIGNAGTLASALRDVNLSFGDESGIATLLGNLGITAVIMLLFILANMVVHKNSNYLKFFVLYIAAIAFNENALSPYLFVIPLTLLVAYHRSVDVPDRSRQLFKTGIFN